MTPCDICKFGPPSSGDGKPCAMCPAEAKESMFKTFRAIFDGNHPQWSDADGLEEIDD